MDSTFSFSSASSLSSSSASGSLSDGCTDALGILKVSARLLVSKRDLPVVKRVELPLVKGLLELMKGLKVIPFSFVFGSPKRF